MGGLRGWSGGLARLAAALALALLVLSPGLDALFCRDAGVMVPARTSAEAVQVVAASVDAEQGRAALGPCGGICLNGHCYHSAPCLPPAPLDSGPLPASPGERQALLNTAVPTEDPDFELTRPPRA